MLYNHTFTLNLHFIYLFSFLKLEIRNYTSVLQKNNIDLFIGIIKKNEEKKPLLLLSSFKISA